MLDEHRFDGIIKYLMTLDQPLRANPNPQTVAKLLNNEIRGFMNKYKINYIELNEILPPEIFAATICLCEDNIITRKQMLDLIGEKLRQAKEIKNGQNQSNNLCEAQAGQTPGTVELVN